jgi:hypothetical protein
LASSESFLVRSWKKIDGAQMRTTLIEVLFYPELFQEIDF